MSKANQNDDQNQQMGGLEEESIDLSKIDAMSGEKDGDAPRKGKKPPTVKRMKSGSRHDVAYER